MTMQLATITNAISGLTVTGLTILDIDEIPDSWDGRVPVIYPEPVDTVTNIDFQNASFGLGVGSSWNIEYDLTYTLLYSEVGSGRGMELYAPAIAKALAFFDKILETATIAGAVTCKPKGISMAGPQADPSGKMFFGAKVTLHILEFIN